jgi:ring-1,2-phenylacetyl-CoA epoxidase subunit PaaD
LANLNEALLVQLLDSVKDPEIPAISIVELGIVRGIVIQGHKVQVAITPTFTGCPAYRIIRQEIVQKLEEAGVEDVKVDTLLSPAWTSDWITKEGRAHLKAFGIAPPSPAPKEDEFISVDSAQCPYCDSQNTRLKNSFGPTLCRAIYFCNNCHQPFEQFRSL